MKKIKVLIGSNGGLTGVYLAKQFKKHDYIYVCGADSAKISAGKFFVEKQFELPNSNASSFIEKLIVLLNREHIDIYLPTHSREIEVVSKNEDKLRKNTRARFIVSPKETFEALDDKVNMNREFQKAGISVPKLIEDFDCDYPIFMKRNLGSGSAGSLIIDNQSIHKAYAKTYNDLSFFELIKGDEYTLDCLFDREGNLIGYNQRKRLKTIGGAVRITQNSHNFDVSEYIKKIAKSWKFCGCVNFQYIVKNGIPYFIDTNLRYPSGGLPLTVASGLDVPMLTVKMLTGERISKSDVNLVPNKKIMYRYFEEIFENEIN